MKFLLLNQHLENVTKMYATDGHFFIESYFLTIYNGSILERRCLNGQKNEGFG